MAKNESTKKTLLVAVLLCFVCSLVVSSAAVLLKPAQVANKALDRKSNILAAAGMLEPGVSVEKQFEQVEPRVVNLKTGRFSDKFDPQNLEPLRLARQPEHSRELSDDEDIAGIGRRENYTVVYLVKDKGGSLDKIILPVRGYGLWSTLYGFLALESDGNTIAGLGFYEHGETPGLGGEVDNPKWKALWPDKKVYGDGEVAIRVIKGEAPKDAEHKVDGLSGATLTSNGVTNLLHFWLGEMGYQKFLDNLRSGEA